VVNIFLSHFLFLKSVFSDKKMIFFNKFLAGPIPLRIREAEIPVVSDAECLRKINAVTEKIFILPASSFCAGGEEGNDACQVSRNFYKLLLVLFASNDNLNLSG